MITLRPAAQRGRTRLRWLDSHHTFSFNQYYDPQNVGFRSLRVLNEDFVEPASGFGTHGHRDMEILSYVLDGALEHRDSTGGGGVIRPGEIQFMRAGTGVAHSEHNASKTEPVHFLQIWIVPDTSGLEPGYDHRVVDRERAGQGWVLLASRDGREQSITVHQDTELHVTTLRAGETRPFALAGGRHAWVQVARGEVRVLDHAMTAGDGAAVSDEALIELSAESDAEILLFDLA